MEILYKNINWIKTKILKYFNEENKENILILHGWWWKSESFKNFAEIIFKKWFNVFIPDLPWFWETKLDKTFDLDEYSIFIEKLIFDLWIEDFILMWHSNWWAISIKLANNKNIKIKKIILYNSAGVRITKKMSFKRKVFKIFSIPFKPFKNFSFFKKLRIVFYKIIWNYDYLNSLKVPFLEETYKNIIGEDLQNIMKNINTETLLIRWEKDTFTPISYWKIIKKNIKNSKMIVLDWEWHSPHLKNVEKLANTFLNNI